MPNPARDRYANELATTPPEDTGPDRRWHETTECEDALMALDHEAADRLGAHALAHHVRWLLIGYEGGHGPSITADGIEAMRSWEQGQQLHRADDQAWRERWGVDKC